MTNYYTHQNEQLYARLNRDTSLSEKGKERMNLLENKTMKFSNELVSLAGEIDELNDFNRLRMKDNIPDNLKHRSGNSGRQPMITRQPFFLNFRFLRN